MKKNKKENRRRKIPNGKKREKKSAASAGSSSSVITHRVETGQKRKSLHTEVPPPKKNCHEEGEEIDPNVCCMCFQNYNDDVISGAGTDWISCTCGRWLHEDCAEERLVDEEGKELFCPYCII